jgi:hypothetical protein
LVTVIGKKFAPDGTVTLRDVAEAAETLARMDPKYTTLFEGVASKLVPVIITEVPTIPLAGANEDIVGALGQAAFAIVIVNNKNIPEERMYLKSIFFNYLISEIFPFLLIVVPSVKTASSL